MTDAVVATKKFPGCFKEPSHRGQNFPPTKVSIGTPKKRIGQNKTPTTIIRHDCFFLVISPGNYLILLESKLLPGHMA